MTPFPIPSLTYAGVFLVLLCPPAQTQEPAADSPPPSVSAADDLANREGEDLLVEGLVSNTRINATGIHFLEFPDTAFVCVTFAQNLAAFPSGPPAEAYKGKWVRVQGKIEMFRGAPQIKLLSPAQIEVVDRPAPPPEPVVSMPSTHQEPAAATPPASSVAASPPAPTPPVHPDVETVDGIPALDWRKYFPSSKP